MSRNESFSSISRLNSSQLWAIAVLSFGIGDVVTTGIGLKIGGVVELHPIAAALFERSVFATMIVLKTVAFGSCYVLWKCTPSPYSLGVPLGLTVLGVYVTIWNSLLLVLTILS